MAFFLQRLYFFSFRYLCEVKNGKIYTNNDRVYTLCINELRALQKVLLNNFYDFGSVNINSIYLLPKIIGQVVGMAINCQR